MKPGVYLYDANSGIIYQREGDYFVPAVPTTIVERDLSLSTIARSRLDWLKEHNPALYAELALQGDLAAHLRDFCVDYAAQVNLLAERMGGDATAEACAREVALPQLFEKEADDGQTAEW